MTFDLLPGPTIRRDRPEHCLTLVEVATLLGLSLRSVQRLIAGGRLRKLQLFRSVRIAPAELARFLEGRPLLILSEENE